MQKILLVSDKQLGEPSIYKKLQRARPPNCSWDHSLMTANMTAACNIYENYLITGWYSITKLPLIDTTRFIFIFWRKWGKWNFPEHEMSLIRY